jgi:site-specific DNA-methyltransferase (adenine-specific)
VTVSYIVGDTRDVVRTLPDASVDLVITSPPFLDVRDYLPANHPDKGRELGKEPTPSAFLDMLLGLTAEWRRLLADHGTLAVELGDTYTNGERIRDGWPTLDKCLALIPELYRVALAYGINPLTGQESPAGRWRVRNNVTWCRPNPPVGSLGDKFRPSTSDLVIACTSEKRWFDLDAVRTMTERHERDAAAGPGKHGEMGHDPARNHNHGKGEYANGGNPAGAPPLDHWIIPPGGYAGAHYATFPTALVEKPIEACCPRRVCRTCGTPSRRLTSDPEYVQSRNGDEPASMHMREGERAADGVNQWGATNGDQSVTRTSTTIGWTSCDCPGTDGIRLDGYHTGTGWRAGLVLDPFAGSGTSLLVASGRARDAIGIDLDDRNADLARERVGMFLEVTHHDQEPAA